MQISVSLELRRDVAMSPVFTIDRVTSRKRKAVGGLSAVQGDILVAGVGCKGAGDSQQAGDS